MTAMSRDRTPNVRQMLDLSTAHLPPVVITELNRFDGVVAHALPWGAWLLWVPDDSAAHAADYDEVPQEVLTVQRYAREHGCDYVLLDVDAQQDQMLPVFEHR